MARIVGYDGGDGEEQLLAALKADFASEVTDAWEKIRTRYMYTGSIIEIAVERGYIKASRLGFPGYIVTKVGCGETHARDCLRCWKLRCDFDRVVEWVKTTNSFKPAKASGPLLYLEAHKAWSERLKPDGAKNRQQKKLTAKELRQLLSAYRSMLDRVGGEHVRWAEEDNREPRVWNQITQERATIEAELSETTADDAFPVTATRDQPVEDGPDEEPDAEAHPGTVRTKDRPTNPVPTEEQYPGGRPNFTVAEPIVPLRRTQRPARKPALALVPPTKPMEPAALDLLRDIAARKRSPVEMPVQEPAPHQRTIGAVEELDELAVAEIETQWELKALRAGRASSEDRAIARWNRAKAYCLLTDEDDEDYVDHAARVMRLQNHMFWRAISEGMTLAAVLRGLT